MAQAPKVLVSPLDWGIGHATRMVPVIRELMRQGADVHLAAGGLSFAFLQGEFPELTFHDLPGYPITYPASANGMAVKMLRQMPAFMKSVKREHALLDKLIAEKDIDGVISDNRYGLYNQKIPCIFVTHQVFIQTPLRLRFLSPLVDRLNNSYIGRFRECWIPDKPGNYNLSGNLSHKSPLPGSFHFIGPLSRFDRLMKNGIPETKDQMYDLVVVLSGPEPQRTILQDKLLVQIRNLKIKAAMVLGKPGEDHLPDAPANCELFCHLETESLFNLIRQSKIVISRPGYSSIMDMAVMGSRAVFIPTPGQTEQEYLGRYLHERGYYLSSRQDHFDLGKALEKAGSYSGLVLSGDNEALKNRIARFLDAL